MGFSYGLGLNTMVNELQQDAGAFKLSEMSKNITNIYTALGQNASIHVDFTQEHLNYKENLEQRVDDNATFLFEFQALLQSKIQELVNKLTAALTSDMEQAISVKRAGQNDRLAMQGFTTANFIDAGAARASYNFFVGYAANGTVQAAGSAAAAPNTVPYIGQAVASAPGPPDYGPNGPIVAEDTPADADFGLVRSVGSAAIQQGIIDTDDPGPLAAAGGLPILDSLQIGLAADFGLTAQTQHDNQISPLDAFNGTTGYHAALDRHNYDIEFVNEEVPLENNVNTINFTPEQQYYEGIMEAKNLFEVTLAGAISQLERAGWLRDAMIYSQELGLFENIQIASSTTTPTGSQTQAEVTLDFVPATASRPDQGGSIDIIFDKWTAFYQS